MSSVARLGRLALLASSLSLSGCFLVAAGAGAAGAIAYTNRGAAASVEGTVDGLFDRSVAAFQQMNIAESGRSTEDNGTERKLVGKRGDTEVTVELERESATLTKVEVVAAKNLVDYDKELAREVLSRIMAR